MTMDDATRAALVTLDRRLNTLLPEEYQGAYDAVEPTPMGAAGLRFDADGRVAWDEIWGSFCDLAMAGGPPHKGRLLQPGTRAEIDAAPERHAEVVEELCRGVRMVADLDATAAPDPGWIRVRCLTDAMAAWLLRAITMENVAVRGGARTIDLPAAPGYRLEKEIKNVITVTAKTCHYWVGHMPRTQQHEIGRLFATIAEEHPLIIPASGEEPAADAHNELAAAIQRQTGLRASEQRYPGWLGLEITAVRPAIWMMRALVVANVLSRREDVILYVPVHPIQDPGGGEVANRVTRVHQLARADGILP
jgi:hypothetical protein